MRQYLTMPCKNRLILYMVFPELFKITLCSCPFSFLKWKLVCDVKLLHKMYITCYSCAKQGAHQIPNKRLYSLIMLFTSCTSNKM